MTANDRRFLRSLRIAADDAKVEETDRPAIGMAEWPPAGGRYFAKGPASCRPFRCDRLRAPDAPRPRPPFLAASGIAQIAASERLQIVVQLVDQRNPGRDVQLDDVLVGDVVEILDQRAQRVAVRRDQHPLAGVNRRRDRLVPVRQESRDRVLQRLGQREIGRRQRRIARIAVPDAAGRPARAAAAECRSCAARS